MTEVFELNAKTAGELVGRHFDAMSTTDKKHIAAAIMRAERKELLRSYQPASFSFSPAVPGSGTGPSEPRRPTQQDETPPGTEEPRTT